MLHDNMWSQLTCDKHYFIAHRTVNMPDNGIATAAELFRRFYFPNFVEELANHIKRLFMLANATSETCNAPTVASFSRHG